VEEVVGVVPQQTVGGTEAPEAPGKSIPYYLLPSTL